jgi:transcription elongation factor GreA
MALEAQKKLEEEIKILDKELKTELPRALKLAIAMGDLRENAEYHAAKERRDFVMARLAQLRQRLSDLAMINVDKIPHDRISLGSTVILFDIDKEEEITYRLVTSEDSDAEQGAISTTSPIGQGLLNKKEGDEIEVKIPSGTRSFEVVSFTTMHDESK